VFEELEDQGSPKGRGRRGASALLSLGIFGALALAVGGAITAHQVRRHLIEQEQKVEFVDLNPLRAPKANLQVKSAVAKKPGTARPKVTAIKRIPANRPEEADGELLATDEIRPSDELIGTDSATETAPSTPPPAPKPEPIVASAEQERETIEAPRFLSGCRAPEVPSVLLSNAATIRIEVEMLIDDQGKVSQARVLTPHPLIGDSIILQCARAQLFRPAQLPDGTKVPYPFRSRFVFKPAQA
jgi:hypothetical protein